MLLNTASMSTTKLVRLRANHPQEQILQFRATAATSAEESKDEEFGLLIDFTTRNGDKNQP
jgi:hypothetical protein